MKVMLRCNNRQRGRVKNCIWCSHEWGKLKTEGGTTPPLARKSPPAIRGFICLALGDFYTVYFRHSSRRRRRPQGVRTTCTPTAAATFPSSTLTRRTASSSPLYRSSSRSGSLFFLMHCKKKVSDISANLFYSVYPCIFRVYVARVGPIRSPNKNSVMRFAFY